jgi:hypothetical protein
MNSRATVYIIRRPTLLVMGSAIFLPTYREIERSAAWIMSLTGAFLSDKSYYSSYQAYHSRFFETENLKFIIGNIIDKN